MTTLTPPTPDRFRATIPVTQCPATLALTVEIRPCGGRDLALRDVPCDVQNGVLFLHGHLPTQYFGTSLRPATSARGGICSPLPTRTEQPESCRPRDPDLDGLIERGSPIHTRYCGPIESSGGTSMPIGESARQEGSPQEGFHVIARERLETDAFQASRPLAGIVEAAVGFPRSAAANLALLYGGVRRHPMRT
jgi:hypothetical protein